MERLTKRNECGDAYYPECYERCYGEGSSEKCNDCDYDGKICKTLTDYEDTGLTPPEIMELKERDMAKAPDYEGDGYDNDGNIIYDTWICPNCVEKYEVDYDDYDFCPNCGQRLKWED